MLVISSSNAILWRLLRSYGFVWLGGITRGLFEKICKRASARRISEYKAPSSSVGNMFSTFPVAVVAMDSFIFA